MVGVTTGTLRYGLWRGPIAKGSPFTGRGLTHHGWVEVESCDADPLAVDYEECRACGHLRCEHSSGFLSECGSCDCPSYDSPPHGPRIFDPTRWVFEDRDPYIFDERDTNSYYDIAGDGLRIATLRPFPSATDHAALKPIKLPQDTIQHIRHVIAGRDGTTLKAEKNGHISVSIPQLAWIANLPLALLGPHARAVYQALDEAGFHALVPIDCREVAMGDGFYGQRKRVEARVKKARK